MDTIYIENLTKNYGNNKGIFDLNLSVSKGQIMGYLGPNGAGKTTTIRLLLGFLNSDKGTCFINNLNCRKDASIIQKDLGYLPGEISLFNDMKADNYLNFILDLRKAKKNNRKDELCKYFELDTKIKIKKMSKGMKQKVAIIQAFMHDPSIVILDEPTSGLDPLMQNKFIEFILSEKNKGKTILLSSHNFEEVEKTCDKVAILKQGRLIDVKSIKELKADRRRIYSITFNSIEETNKFLKEDLDIIFHNNNRVDVSIVGNIKKLTNILNNYDIQDLDVLSSSLEEIFLGFYGENKWLILVCLKEI